MVVLTCGVYPLSTREEQGVEMGLFKDMPSMHAVLYLRCLGVPGDLDMYIMSEIKLFCK